MQARGGGRGRGEGGRVEGDRWRSGGVRDREGGRRGNHLCEDSTSLASQMLSTWLQRDKMLASVEQLAPSIFPFVHSVYSTPSSLFWGDRREGGRVTER